MGDFNVLPLEPPFTPERYMKAIETCENADMEVISLESLTKLYHQYIDYYDELEEHFKSKKLSITKLSNKKVAQNGSTNA